MMKRFDTNVQLIKLTVLEEVAKEGWCDNSFDDVTGFLKKIIPGRESTMRCCVYKERAIVFERMQLARGKDRAFPGEIEIIDIACDECPDSGYAVGENCRGCLAHWCENACKLDAITFDEHQKASIDKKKCVNCGACAKKCAYNAIVNHKRPCERACKIGAIHMSENKAAAIDYDKCIACGACTYQCPFGAISDKSLILDVIKLIKESCHNSKYNVYAMIAPAIAGQFIGVKPGQVASAIKALGFKDVIEVAEGADIVAYEEAKELGEADGLLINSCCPAVVKYIKNKFPKLEDNISKHLSPAVITGKIIKNQDPNSKTVFIGPCIAKKMELKEKAAAPYMDSVITFEELQALLDSRNIEIEKMPETTLDAASCFGRIFARTGGLAKAVRQGLEENGMADFDYKPISCNGIEECKAALMKASKGILKNNFIEGMACVDGCIGGGGCLTHSESNKKHIDEFADEAKESLKPFASGMERAGRRHSK